MYRLGRFVPAVAIFCLNFFAIVLKFYDPVIREASYFTTHFQDNSSKTIMLYFSKDCRIQLYYVCKP